MRHLNRDAKKLVSVIIPYNGDSNVIHTLNSLKRQSVGPKQFEVILVVESGSSTDAVLTCNFPFSVRLIPFRPPRSFRGHSAALMRNLGASIASGDLFIFIDSDCIVRSNCISRHLFHRYRDPRNVVCGAMHELPAQHQRMIQQSRLPRFGRIKSVSLKDFRLAHRPQFAWENLYSSNFSLPRRLFRSSRGFDESGFRCHDMEFGYRLHTLGSTIHFAPDCEVIHIEHPRVAASKIEQAQGWRLLGRKWPEIAVVAEDRAMESLRNYADTTNVCEVRFSLMNQELEGYRVDNTLVLSPKASRDDLELVLRGIPHVTTELTGGKLLHLGLHRNCWDYSVLVPDRETLEHPLVSVLVAAHNSDETIARCLGSVLVQTVQQFEIIVVDDHSEDDTLDILHQFTRDGRLRVFLQRENQGQSHCLNVALSAARAPIVVQLDSDDWLESTALSEILQVFSRHPRAAAAYGSPIVHEGSRTRREEGKLVRTTEKLLTYSELQAPRAYLTQKLKGIGGWSTADWFDGRYFEDRLTLARVCRVGRVQYLSKPVYNCERRPRSLSHLDREAYARGKLLVLWQQANTLRKRLNYTWDGRSLSATFEKLYATTPPKSWSIIIPVYNRRELLEYTLRSWLESDLLDRIAEIIVVDDGSDQSIFDLAIQKHPRIAVLRLNEHLGPAAARNRGAALAKHEFLFFCDSDHIVPPDVLSCHEARHAQDHNPSVVAGGLFGNKVATFVDPSKLDHHSLKRLTARLQFDVRFGALMSALVAGKPVRLLANEPNIWEIGTQYGLADQFRAQWVRIAMFLSDFEAYDHRWLGVGGGNLSMPKRLFEDLRGFDESMPPMEDWDFGARCQKRRVRIVLAPEVQALHQLHPRERQFATWSGPAFRRLKSKHFELVAAAIEDDLAPGGDVLRHLQRTLKHNSSLRLNQESLEYKDGLEDFFSLTFDDGPNAIGTPLILDVLQHFEVKAAFFLLCSHLHLHRELCQRIANAGHEIGIHGWHHDDVTLSTSREAALMLRQCCDAVEDTCGITPRFARPPYGRASIGYIDAAAQLGISVVGAHLSISDWHTEVEKNLIFEIAEKGFRGKVLLFHDGAGDVFANARALGWMLRQASVLELRAIGLSDWSKMAKLPGPFIRQNDFSVFGRTSTQFGRS